MLEAIFEAHFEHDADITSHSDLVKAAVAAGMAEEGVAALLRSDEGATEIDESAARARKSGVSSVPTIEINGYRIEGAEDASAFYEALVNAKNEQS